MALRVNATFAHIDQREFRAVGQHGAHISGAHQRRQQFRPRHEALGHPASCIRKEHALRQMLEAATVQMQMQGTACRSCVRVRHGDGVEVVAE